MAEKRKEVRYIAQKFANAILADASPYVISPDGLQALNAFLDELLFILVDSAKGLETTRIKAAVYQTFPTALGKNAIVEAELEAKSYIDMGGKDTANQGPQSNASVFNASSDESRVEQVFEQFRAKCQYYSKLGERLGSPAGSPSNSMVVPTLIAIYVTAVLEHVAEYVLQIASTVADRQDHADMITVREIYVALQEDRQIESTFETMILKSQLQKRFRNSLIMPGTGSKPEEPQPATVKRSGSWGKQLRLGNSDKPKLEVQLPTDIEDDDIPIDPNRPQFGDWDSPPDEESKMKKKSEFEALFSSGETMKVSLTPNRLRTIEVHRKAGGIGGNTASRSSSRATSVLGGRFHNRRPSNAQEGTTPTTNNKTSNGTSNNNAQPVLNRKNSQAASLAETNAPSSIPATPSVPAIPANLGAIAKQQQSNQPGWSLSSEQGLGSGDKSKSTLDSQLALSPLGSTNMASSPSPTPRDGSFKATSDLAQSLGSNLTKSSYSDMSEPPVTPTTETTTTKKENPLKSFMGRLGRNSIQRTSSDSNSPVASSPTSIRSFTITGPQQSSSGTGSASNSTNGSIYSGHSGLSSTPLSTPPGLYETSQQQPPKQPTSPVPQNRVLSQDSRANVATMSGFPLPPDPSAAAMSGINRRGSASVQGNVSSVSLANSKTLVSAPQLLETTPATPRSPKQPPRSMSPEVAVTGSGGVPIPSRNASLNVASSPTKSSSHEAPRTGLEAGLPRPLSSPRSNSYTATTSSPPTPTPPSSGRSVSPHSVSPRPSLSSLQTSPLHQQLKSNSLDGQVSSSAASSNIVSPSPLSSSALSNNGSSGRDVSPSGSTTSLIMPGKVQHMQEKLSKTTLTPAHGFKAQEHLQNLPNRISLEGTIRANPFYQLDRSSSGRSSLADLSATNGGSSPSSTDVSSIATSQRLRSGSGRGSPPVVAATTKPDQKTTPAVTPSVAVAAAAAALTTATTLTRSVSSDSETDEDREKNADGMVSPATSPEMGTLKDRLPSATTRTLTAAAVAAKQQQQQQKQMATPPSSGKGRANEEEEEEEVVEVVEMQTQVQMEKIPYVAPVPRTTTSNSNNRHSIFVDETAQAMDAMSRARHRQSMIDNGGQDIGEEDEDEDEDEEVYSVTHGIEPPEKWHYSDEDDEDEDDEEEVYQEAQDVAYTPNVVRRRKRQDSFVSAKSVFNNGSTVSLVDQARNDTQDEEENAEQENAKEQLVRSLDKKSLANGRAKGSNAYTDLVAASQGDDVDAQNGGDEDESDDSEDLEDNDDEEGQDRRIYLQQIRAKEREARRLARSTGSGSSTADAATSTATTSMINGTTAPRKKSSRKGRYAGDRPPTPTTPVPTTQIIPLTPTDLVLIRQKLFAAGTFEASMRMLDTIFHAAMAKMVEGRERGVQTEPVSFLELEEGKELAAQATATPEVSKKAETTKAVTRSTGTSMEPTRPKKHIQRTAAAAAATATLAPEDDDDEDRIVEWLLGGV